MSDLLQAQSLVKSYRRRTVVRDVSVQVAAGEVVGLLGPNGAGKTTTFYMMVGLVRPNRGHIFLQQRDITALPMHERARMGLGYLPQEPSVFRQMSAADNILAVLETLPLSKAERQDRLDQLLAELHLGLLRDTKGHSLSGGERRRVEIARALAMSPRFILLDEPFAGIDPISVLEIQRLIQDLRERGIGILITDHNVRETLGICERAYILHDGKVLTAGSPQEIVDDPMVRQVYLGDQFRI
ncbi:LPS export ABC transporter ATP-binding protein [Acidithiobacillus thiooxidans]|jgi:lipopolysaccharide export system ATP-binding protein|uniref:ABC transporter ATP-binding protein n=2 Tax=Acidithiobacillus thiooxidans TaxID=930 RepID=A0A1C2J3D7_ACITH|nr:MULTISPECIES: LPS export ABC transporter ATP-binding protein [Acidithiobacillus]MBE7565297.1 LPS export ABC transporter ATP-binding protein [Acidithiobacillus sp. HP-11]MBU2741788.1 LPS export ABC transporter ATP-binding protein [Acidithiobacillus albertensis]MBU2752906.1 LPS export ABC transporter ATP-binding protein [Acidithiobacillus thiooxidans]MBU2793554.1 LPS export ABC transporter ATP-binding protein [Acidithiobacillus thiooxidans]MBU2810241.1 LPS export ABC transporter ATP-binding p